MSRAFWRGRWVGTEHAVEDVGAADGGFDAVAVVLLQHAEVFVAELVGDVFDG